MINVVMAQRTRNTLPCIPEELFKSRSRIPKKKWQLGTGMSHHQALQLYCVSQQEPDMQQSTFIHHDGMGLTDKRQTPDTNPKRVYLGTCAPQAEWKSAVGGSRRGAYVNTVLSRYQFQVTGPLVTVGISVTGPHRSQAGCREVLALTKHVGA
jgi:hypothetical protein